MAEKESKAANVHALHRQRIRTRIAKTGFEGLHDHEIIEFLLFFAIPRGDVNPIAHALVDRFGSLSGVLEASVPELQSIKGIGETSALFLHSMLPIFRLYTLDKERQRMHNQPLTSPKLIIDYVKPHFIGLHNELVLMFCMDNRGAVLHLEKLGEGSVGSVTFTIRRLVEIAMQYHAYGVVLAHNHPHGAARPSNEDINMTSRVHSALQSVEIQLLDHVIIADDDAMSMREQGLIFRAR